MRLRLFAAVLLAAPLLSGCVVISSAGKSDRAAAERTDPRATTPRAAPFEAIHGAWFDDRGFNARLNSNGCTTKDTVAVDVERHALGVRLTVRRLKPDLCRALLREGVVLTWSLEELGLGREPVEVRNTLSPW